MSPKDVLVVDTNSLTLTFAKAVAGKANIVAGGGPLYDYIPGYTSDWAAPAPTTVTDAIDRLARVLSIHLTIPIPTI